MDKIIDVKTGKELVIGQPFDLTISGPNGSMNFKGDMLKESILALALICGAAKKVREADEAPKKEVPEVPTDIKYYLSKFAEKMGTDLTHTLYMCCRIADVHPSAIWSILLKEIAYELDKRYPTHISESKEIYYINTFNGTIVRADKGWIKSYRNFAAFRSIEDARVACKILSPITKDLFKK